MLILPPHTGRRLIQPRNCGKSDDRYVTTVSDTSVLLPSLLHTHSRLTAFFPGLPGYAGTRRISHSGFSETEMMWWQWHQPDHMQVICTSLQMDNHASTSSLKFLRAGCPSCRPTNSVKALKAYHLCFSIYKFSLVLNS